MDVSVSRPICDVTTTATGPDRTVLTVHGELDLACPGTVLDAFRRAGGSGRDVVVDLRATRFIDSSGLMVLLTCLRRTTDRGRSCVVVCPPGPVLRVFELTGLCEAFDVQASLEDAEARLAVHERTRSPAAAAR
jgi:anti-sigma B factor antagonist